MPAIHCSMRHDVLDHIITTVNKKVWNHRLTAKTILEGPLTTSIRYRNLLAKIYNQNLSILMITGAERNPLRIFIFQILKIPASYVRTLRQPSWPPCRRRTVPQSAILAICFDSTVGPNFVLYVLRALIATAHQRRRIKGDILTP